MADWSELLFAKRFGDLLNRALPVGKPEEPDFAEEQFRIPHERDHDRVLFSTPFRRMGDKTQVFPLESIESIRSRLTHSYEVSNLARSMGVEISVKFKDDLPIDGYRAIPSILSAVGLAHDIGNPPFGHQGEHAIRAWYKRNSARLFEPNCNEELAIAKDKVNLTAQHKNDFLQFEGNAQTLRVVTKLQVIGDDLGLNLTLGTLSALMKYVAPSDALDDKIHARKKVGFFASEQAIVETIRGRTGLSGNSRNPLALIMEACDDIAYSVLDAEDAIKKGLVSLNDLLAHLENYERTCGGDNVIDVLRKLSLWEIESLRSQQLHPGELQDIATQKFRVHAIHLMISATIRAFEEKITEIMSGKFEGELIKSSPAGELCKAMKKFVRENVFNHKSVLEAELLGFNTINRLMDFLWIGITDRKDFMDVASERRTPFSAYVYSRISKNYKRIFEGKVTKYHDKVDLPIRYREAQLLSDMISGMTDQFCFDLHDDILGHFRKMEAIDGATA